MPFQVEPTGYEKTVLSELQGAWQNLRDEVAEQAGFPDWERALFHIAEAMSWESVRNLQHMRKSLVLVRNLLGQDGIPVTVKECLDVINDLMTETLHALNEAAIRPHEQIYWKLENHRDGTMGSRVY
jgi:hypothetical protein